jgi:hypothetical protein
MMMLSVSPQFLSAQVKMRDVFCQMPDTLAPYLTENNRLDLVDFIESGMTAEVTNKLEGKTRLEVLTADYAKLKLSDASTMEFRLLTHEAMRSGSGAVNSSGSDAVDSSESYEEVDSLIQELCVVWTYGTSNRESVVSFYTPDWTPLPADKRMPQGSRGYEAQLNPQEPTLTLVNDGKLDFPANEEQEKIEMRLINLKWNGRSFNLY